MKLRNARLDVCFRKVFEKSIRISPVTDTIGTILGDYFLKAFFIFLQLAINYPYEISGPWGLVVTVQDNLP